tara:strand:- start:295 stop:459 length:165 start_codon:yes stop_codon:yes gene_type:complete
MTLKIQSQNAVVKSERKKSEKSRNITQILNNCSLILKDEQLFIHPHNMGAKKEN